MSNHRKRKTQVIRQHGEPNKAKTIWGFTAYREKELFAPDPYNTLVPCLNYDNHFIYEVPKEYRGAPAFMCTCGSAAVVVGPGSYIHDASISNFRSVEVAVTPENVRMVRITRGFVFACLLRNCVVNPETGEIWGRHADGST